jgi:hypothetical protein
MNTQKELAQTLALTAIATLLRFKPSIKIDEALTANIADDLATLLPSDNADKLTDVTRSMLPSLKGGALVDTLSDDVVIHIPAFAKATKAEQTDISIAAQSVTFTLDSYSVESVRYFSVALSELVNKQPNYEVAWNDNCKLTALVDYVIPVLKGLATVTTSTTSAGKDYLQCCDVMGLTAFVNPIIAFCNDNKVKLESVLTFDQHKDDNTAINLFVTSRFVKGFRALLTVEKVGKTDKTVFNVGNISYIVEESIDKVKEDEEGNEVVTSRKYRFMRYTKTADINFTL